MPGKMRLIDAEPVLEELRRLRGIAARKDDTRAVDMLDCVLEMLEDAPEVPLRVDTEKIKKKKYGEYKNVLLSDDEMKKLQEQFPDDWRERIEGVSAYVAASGKPYKNYLAVIRNWARREEKDKPPEGERSFETEETLQAALRRTYGGLENEND